MSLLRLWLPSLLIVLPLLAFEPDSLGSDAEISLLTIAPGNELYMTFGHSAIRITDPAQKLDRIYNYGTFSFDEPGFYMKFCRGQLDYMLSAYDYRFAYSLYKHEKRTMVAQVLNLTPPMKQQIYHLLETNHLPENRRYRYDFFFDNCATRIRDIFQEALGDSLHYYLAAGRDMSFRNYIDLYLQNLHWSDFGIDLVLGARTDYPADANAAMFLPDYLYESIDGATLMMHGRTEPFVARRDTIFTFPPPPAPALSAPWLVMLGILLLTVLLTLSGHYQPVFLSVARWFDVLLFAVTGLLGIVILLLWFATDHKVTPDNLNILWTWPVHLLVLPSLLRREAPVWLRRYLLLYLAALCLLVAGWFFWPQQLHPAILPLLAALGLRSYVRQQAGGNNGLKAAD